MKVILSLIAAMGMTMIGQAFAAPLLVAAGVGAIVHFAPHAPHPHGAPPPAVASAAKQAPDKLTLVPSANGLQVVAK